MANDISDENSTKPMTPERIAEAEAAVAEFNRIHNAARTNAHGFPVAPDERDQPTPFRAPAPTRAAPTRAASISGLTPNVIDHDAIWRKFNSSCSGERERMAQLMRGVKIIPERKPRGWPHNN